MTGAFHSPAKSGVRVNVRLQPAGRADKVLGLAQDADGNVALKASVTKAPEGGKANAALIKMLAKEWKLAKSDLEVVKGQTSRNKVLELSGDTAELTALLDVWAEQKGIRAEQ
ncbi:DUF167 domain-containing protein [Pseudomonadota bacterium]